MTDKEREQRVAKACEIFAHDGHTLAYDQIELYGAGSTIREVLKVNRVDLHWVEITLYREMPGGRGGTERITVCKVTECAGGTFTALRSCLSYLHPDILDRFGIDLKASAA